MKFSSILLCTIFCCIQGIAQNDTGIVNRTPLKRGFYKTYQEYLDNSPSITADFTTTVFTASKKDPTIIAGTFRLKNSNVQLNKIWGFCDGESVFIRYKVLLNNNYYKAQVLGPHPYFLFKEKTILAAGPPLMALATAAATASLPAGFEIMAVTGRGRPKYVWMGTMKKMLADQPELLRAFKKEVKVISDRSRVKYLRLYSEAAKVKVD